MLWIKIIRSTRVQLLFLIISIPLNDAVGSTWKTFFKSNPKDAPQSKAEPGKGTPDQQSNAQHKPSGASSTHTEPKPPHPGVVETKTEIVQTETVQFTARKKTKEDEDENKQADSMIVLLVQAADRIMADVQCNGEKVCVKKAAVLGSIRERVQKYLDEQKKNPASKAAVDSQIQGSPEETKQMPSIFAVIEQARQIQSEDQYNHFLKRHPELDSNDAEEMFGNLQENVPFEDFKKIVEEEAEAAHSEPNGAATQTDAVPTHSRRKRRGLRDGWKREENKGFWKKIKWGERSFTRFMNKWRWIGVTLGFFRLNYTCWRGMFKTGFGFRNKKMSDKSLRSDVGRGCRWLVKLVQNSKGGVCKKILIAVAASSVLLLLTGASAAAFMYGWWAMLAFDVVSMALIAVWRLLSNGNRHIGNLQEKVGDLEMQIDARVNVKVEQRLLEMQTEIQGVETRMRAEMQRAISTLHEQMQREMQIQVEQHINITH